MTQKLQISAEEGRSLRHHHPQQEVQKKRQKVGDQHQQPDGTADSHKAPNLGAHLARSSGGRELQQQHHFGGDGTHLSQQQQQQQGHNLANTANPSQPQYLSQSGSHCCGGSGSTSGNPDTSKDSSSKGSSQSNNNNSTGLVGSVATEAKPGPSSSAMASD